MSQPVIINCEQGTPEWFEARRGIPTASMFKAVMAKGDGKTRKSYMQLLAAEIITGDPGETFQSSAMERGKIMEDQARDYYAFVNHVEPQRVGFIRNGNIGASPDSLIGNNGGVEIKTQRSDLLIETILKDQVPPEHIAQLQGTLMVSGRDWWDIVVFWPGMPYFVKRVTPDKLYITILRAELDRFNDELHALVERVRRYGKAAA